MCSTRVITYSFYLITLPDLLALILRPSTQRVEIRIGVLAIFCCMYVEDERFEKWPELLMSNGRDRELYTIYYTPPSMADQEVMTC